MNTTVAIAQQHPELAEQGIAQIRSVLTRSATDADFRRKLLDEPRAALHEALGAAFPERLDVRFVENTADATLVLPRSSTPTPSCRSRSSRRSPAARIRSPSGS